MAAQKTLHPRVQKEAEKNLPRMAEHHDEGHQRTPRATDLKVTEMSPVDLALLAGKRAQTQIGFSFRTRPMAGFHMYRSCPHPLASEFRDKDRRRTGWCRMASKDRHASARCKTARPHGRSRRSPPDGRPGSVARQPVSYRSACRHASVFQRPPNSATAKRQGEGKQSTAHVVGISPTGDAQRSKFRVSQAKA